MRRLPVVSSAIACVLLVAALADRTAPAASVPEVLIGDVLPLTGNFASLGQQYLWAGQTVEDIIHNDYAELAAPPRPEDPLPGPSGTARCAEPLLLMSSTVSPLQRDGSPAPAA